MAYFISPIPNQPVSNTHEWRDWFFRLSQAVNNGTTVEWGNIIFNGSNITDIQVRLHNTLQGLQGGNITGTEYYHLSAAQYNSLTTNNYGSFSNNVDQLGVANNTPAVLNLNTTDMSNNMSLATNKITIATSGNYNVQFSIQFVNTHSQAHNAWVWLRKNGTDLAGTGSKYDVPSTHGSSDGYLIAVANFFVNITAGDYIELVWAADQIYIASPLQQGVYLEAYTASTSPFTMPSVPSSVVTISQVS